MCRLAPCALFPNIKSQSFPRRPFHVVLTSVGVETGTLITASDERRASVQPAHQV